MKVPVGIINAIDEYYRVSTEIKMLEAQKKELKNTIEPYMEEHDLDAIEAKKAEANYSTREVKIIDPEAYLEALDGDIDKLLSSVTVRMDPTDDRAGAKSYLGKDDIESICETVETPVLRVKKLKVKPVHIPISTGVAGRRVRRLATA